MLDIRQEARFLIVILRGSLAGLFADMICRIDARTTHGS
jgi:hypothetical protein